jgi:hypothetical protein
LFRTQDWRHGLVSESSCACISCAPRSNRAAMAARHGNVASCEHAVATQSKTNVTVISISPA